MLKKLLKRQAELQEVIGVERKYRFGEQAIKEQCLALIVEATEVLNEVNWKHWHKHKKEFDKQALAYELADCLQFIGNIANAAFIDAEMLEAAVNYKQDTTETRFVNKGYCGLCCNSGWVGCRSIHIDEPENDPGMHRCPKGCEVPE